MTAHEFNKLSLNEAKDFVFVRSLLIDKKRLYSDLETRVYMFDDFYIQSYVNIKTGQVLNIRAIETDSDWDEFLSWLNFDVLLQK